MTKEKAARPEDPTPEQTTFYDGIAITYTAISDFIRRPECALEQHP